MSQMSNYVAAVRIDDEITRFAASTEIDEAVRRVTYLCAVEHGMSHQLAGSLAEVSVYEIGLLDIHSVEINDHGELISHQTSELIPALEKRTCPYPVGPMIYMMLESEAFFEWYGRAYLPARRGDKEITVAKLCSDLERLVRGQKVRYRDA